MAPLPTIPNIVRVDFNWPVVNGVAPHSTFHISTATDDLEQIALGIGDAYGGLDNSIFEFMYTGYTVNEVTLTPLDGETAGQAFPLGGTMSGNATGGLLPNVAAVMSFRTAQRGPRGRGRIYLGPCGEADISDGLLDSGKRTDVINAWVEFNVALSGSSAAAQLAVASYTHSDANSVTSFTMRTQAGTMRKRQDQLL
jgi:hypothetical protein